MKAKQTITDTRALPSNSAPKSECCATNTRNRDLDIGVHIKNNPSNLLNYTKKCIVTANVSTNLQWSFTLTLKPTLRYFSNWHIKCISIQKDNEINTAQLKKIIITAFRHKLLAK